MPGSAVGAGLTAGGAMRSEAVERARSPPETPTWAGPNESGTGQPALRAATRIQRLTSQAAWTQAATSSEALKGRRNQRIMLQWPYIIA